MSFVRLFGGALLACLGCSFDVSGFPRDAARPSPDGSRIDASQIDTGVPMPTGIATAVPLPTTKTIVIDGDLDDWDGATFSSFSSLTSGHVDSYGIGYAASVSVQFAIYYTPGALYFAFRVADTIPGEPSAEFFDDDSVEIYLDTDGDAGGPYEPHDHYLLAASAGGCRQYGGGGFPITQCQAVATPSIGYNIEVVVSLVSIDLSPPLPAHIGFGLGVNDDDKKDNNPPFPDDAIDGYVPWFWDETGGCTNGCCDGDARAQTHTEGWCDTSRLGRLVFD